MNKVASGFWQTISLGFIFILPILLILFLVEETLSIMHGLIDQLITFLPGDLIVGETESRIAAFILFAVVCLALGILLKTGFGKQMRVWFENRVLNRIPVYQTVKNLTMQLTGMAEGDSTQFAPAALEMGSTLVFAYIIEQHDNGYMTVLMVSAPGATTGSIRYVPAREVHRIDATLAEVFKSINRFGIGAGKFMSPIVAKNK